MILRSIRVSGWRCFVEPIAVGPLEEGINVLHAPNAAGKSTLFEALRRGLLDRHGVEGEDVKALRPWGRELSPLVTVEFAHEGTEYRITKQFLDKATSVLERKEEGRFRRLAEGDAADEQVRKLLRTNPPGRGLAQPKNWGLAQILWAPQGKLELSNLTGDLVTDIRKSLGDQVSGPGSGPVERRIEEKYLEIFTPGGKLKTGKDAPAVVKQKDELKKAEEGLQDAQRLHQKFEEAVRNIEDLRTGRAQTERDKEELAKKLKETRARAETYKDLLAEQKQRGARAETAEARYGELRQQIELIAGTRKELAETENRIRALEEELGPRVREVEQREKEAERAKSALEDVRRERKTVDAARDKADAARRFVGHKEKLAELNETIGKVREASQELDKLKEARGKPAAPDSKTMRDIQKAIKARDDAQAHIEASLITLEIVPKKSITVDVISGEHPGKKQLNKDHPVQLKGSPVVADIKGIARVRAWGPGDSIEKHRETHDKAVKKLEELTEPFGTTDQDELYRLAENAQKLENEIKTAEARLETLLGDKSIQDLERETALVNSALRKLADQHAAWKKLPPDVKALETAAKETERSFIETVESAERDSEKAQAALRGAATAKATSDTKMQETRKHAASLQSRLAELTSDDKQDVQRQEELKALLMSWDASKERLEKIECDLGSYEDDPAAAAAGLEKQLQAFDAAAKRARDKETREEGRLEHLAANGPYSALARREEEVARLERDVKDEELRVGAISFLHKTMVDSRREMTDAVREPVEAAATRTFQRIAGGRLGDIKLGETFGPSRVSPEFSNGPVELKNVSGGEQEQIYLATRLALAEVLARDERQLVVFDDVLLATDTGRLARAMKVMEDAAQKLQILILTCHPEKYRGLADAKFLDIETAARGGE